MSKATLYERLGLAIKKARWQKMVKQKDLAKILKVSPSYVCEIEKGLKSPSIEMLELIEQELGPVWINK
jgi:ribosome-binding protein aMBF1 (putative translation factor)